MLYWGTVFTVLFLKNMFVSILMLDLSLRAETYNALGNM
jgi:hypothetical protein